MTYSLIVSQGRVADRTDGALVGARLAGEALSGLLGTTAHIVGTPSPAIEDDWRESLPAARDVLSQLTSALRAALDSASTPILATSTCAASLATLPTVAERFPDAVVL